MTSKYKKVFHKISFITVSLKWKNAPPFSQKEKGDEVSQLIQIATTKGTSKPVISHQNNWTIASATFQYGEAESWLNLSHATAFLEADKNLTDALIEIYFVGRFITSHPLISATYSSCKPYLRVRIKKENGTIITEWPDANN